LPRVTPHSSAKDHRWLRFAAHGAGIFSTCAKRQYLAIVVDPNGKVLGMGYNGSPAGTPHCNEGACPRFQQGSAPGSSYDNCIAVHAEANALLHTDFTNRRGASLYVNGPPCWDCGKLIANSGIRRLCYFEDDSYADFGRVREFLELASVKLFPYSREAVGV